MQQQKWCRIQWIGATAQFDEGEHEQAASAFHRDFPGDPGIDLTRVTFLHQRKRYSEAFEYLDHFYEATHDPIIDSQRSVIYRDKGELEAARSLAEQAVKNIPHLEDLHWNLVEMTVRQKDHAATAKCLTEIKRRFRQELVDLKTLPVFADFVASPEYAEWLTEQEPMNPAEKSAQ